MGTCLAGGWRDRLCEKNVEKGLLLPSCFKKLASTGEPPRLSLAELLAPGETTAVGAVVCVGGHG